MNPFNHWQWESLRLLAEWLEDVIGINEDSLDEVREYLGGKYEQL